MEDQLLAQTGGFHTTSNLSQALKTIINQHYQAVNPEQVMPGFVAEALHVICHNLAKAIDQNMYNPHLWGNVASCALEVQSILNDALAKQQEG